MLRKISENVRVYILVPDVKEDEFNISSLNILCALNIFIAILNQLKEIIFY